MWNKDSYHQIEIIRQRITELRYLAKNPAEAASGRLESLEALQTALEELKVAEEELFEQNEELIAARQALETERQRYQDLFNFAPDGYLLTDMNGTIQEANRAVAHLFSVERHYLVSKPLPARLDAGKESKG
ncbi:MAG: PAS domain-containing protein [Acidobacteria bacterium]|nr:PAS domain-containing protein [Acidobacteriota bacterium]